MIHSRYAYSYALACSLGLLACTGTVGSETSPGAGVATSALFSGAVCEPDNALGVASALEKALLDTIAYTEGTRGHGKDGYNVTFGYRYFDSCEVHPNIKVCSGSLCSTAAGRYQFLHKTYVGLKMPSFWPEDQERGALELIDRRGVVLPAAPLTATEFANALDKLSYEWSSLPPGRYGQPRLTHQQIRDEYCKLAGCGNVAPAVSDSPLEPLIAWNADAEFVAIQRDGMLYRYQSDAQGHLVNRPISSGWQDITGMGARADYDEDGTDDFLILEADLALEVYLGDQAGDFDLGPIGPSEELLVTLGAGADYDGDDHADFIGVDTAGSLLLMLGDGTAHFAADIISPLADDVQSLGGGADYTGDGHADFVVLRDDGSTSLYAGDGSGQFEPELLDQSGAALRLLTSSDDYTGDGAADFLALARGANAYVYAGQPDGGFEARALGAGWDTIRFVD